MGPTDPRPPWARHPWCVTDADAAKHLGLIDEYEFVVQPIVAGHGATLFAGLRERLDLELVGRREFRSGAVALRYLPGRATA